MGMSSVRGILQDYIDSLKSARDGKLKPGTLLFQLGIPFGCGIAAGAVRFGVSEAENIVTGVSIVAALMCGVATLLFQTRIDLRQRFENSKDPFLVERDLRLVDGLFSQVMWSILSGFLLVLFLVLKSSFSSMLASFDVLVRIACCVAWCLIVNFVFTVGVILKRMRCVYITFAKGKKMQR